MKRLLAPLFVLVMLIAACGGGSDDAGVASAPPTGGNDPTAPAGGGAAGTMPADMGPAISVEAALERADGESFVVVGYVFVRADGSVVLSDAIAESFPPQPGGARVTVTGLDAQTLPLVEGPPGGEITAWTEQPVELFGSMNGGAFAGASLAAS